MWGKLCNSFVSKDSFELNQTNKIENNKNLNNWSKEYCLNNEILGMIWEKVNFYSSIVKIINIYNNIRKTVIEEKIKKCSTFYDTAIK